MSGQEREVPIEAVGAVVLYLQECRRAKVKPSESEIARVAVHAADLARGALAARDEPQPEIRFDQITLDREEFEQIRRAQGFALFVAALDRPFAANVRRKITLERLIEKAKDALADDRG